MRLEVTPAELDVNVGEPIVLQVEVYNSRSVIDGYQATRLGLRGQPFTSEPRELSLFPESSGVMLLTFTLPPNFPAGPRVIGVRVASVVNPDEWRPGGAIHVAPVEAATSPPPPEVTGPGKRATSR